MHDSCVSETGHCMWSIAAFAEKKKSDLEDPDQRIIVIRIANRIIIGLLSGLRSIPA